MRREQRTAEMSAFCGIADRGRWLSVREGRGVFTEPNIEQAYFLSPLVFSKFVLLQYCNIQVS